MYETKLPHHDTHIHGQVQFSTSISNFHSTKPIKDYYRKESFVQKSIKRHLAARTRYTEYTVAGVFGFSFFKDVYLIFFTVNFKHKTSKELNNFICMFASCI